MSVERHAPRERVAAHHRAGSGVVRIGYPIGVRTVPLLARERLTPRMVRLTLGGPGLEGFHTYQADDHIKIVFPGPDGTRRDPVANDDLTLDWPRPSPTTRKYTVRRFTAGDAAAGTGAELDLDVVLHDGGVASTWAASAEVGEQVTIAGPPGAKAFPHTYAHYLFAVDATALPAVARWLEESPQDVSAHVVVETGEAAEHDYPLAPREGVRVSWLVREGTRSLLADTVRSLPRPPERTFLFAAGEAGDIKPLRAWSAGRLDALFTGYWKRGVAGLED